MTKACEDAIVHQATRVIMMELRCYDVRNWHDLADYLLEQVPGVDKINVGHITNKAIGALTAMGFAKRGYDEEYGESTVEIQWEVYNAFMSGMK